MPTLISSPSDELRSAISAVRDEGVETDREAELLWILRNQLGLSAAESYENVFPSGQLPTVGGTKLDALAVTIEREVVAVTYVLMRDSVADMLRSVKALSEALDIDQSEEKLAETQASLRKLLSGALRAPHTERVRRVICVVATSTTRAQINKIKSAGPDGCVMEVLDLAFLTSIAHAESTRERPQNVIRIATSNDEWLHLNVGDTRGLVIPVRATDVAQWGGIEDRTLFDLNVRFGLGMNRVRHSLDKALTGQGAPSEFIAYHNGITGVCDRFEITDDEVAIYGLSVVNGAQTVVAIDANRDVISEDIRILLKIVEAAPSSELAQNIAIRSNTQNPVTSRNLQALDASQVRLTQELAGLGYQFVVRPGEPVPVPDRAIQNDDAAQLLCSMYLRKPALAVKRQVLFEPLNYEQLFPEDLDPAKVVFAFQTRRVVDGLRSEAPPEYQRAWALTALTLFYMTSEALRSDPEFAPIVDNPTDAVRDDAILRARLTPVARAAISVLFKRADRTTDEPDDFKVAFKHTRTLTDLGASAATAWRSERQVGQ